MKHTLILIISFFLCLQAHAQSDFREDFKESCLISEYEDSTERLSEITGYDFSQILQFDRYNFDLVIRGYIGSNYQRIQVHFISVIKNPDLPSQYFVFGKTKVNNNICDFQGTIKLLNDARKYVTGHMGESPIPGILMSGQVNFIRMINTTNMAGTSI